MKATAIGMVVGLVLCFGAASPAIAGKKDEAWAKCLWEKVPTTTANWLAMTPVKPDRSVLAAMESAEEAIQYRLRAACERTLTPAGKNRAPSLMPKAVRTALQTLRPPVIEADRIEPKAWRCDYYFQDDLQLKNRARFEWGFEDAGGREIWTTTDFGFARVGGGAVYLTKGAGIKKCFTVQADGTLANA